MQHQQESPNQFEAQVLREIKKLGEDIRKVGVTASEAHELVEDHQRMIMDHERTLYGHEDSRRHVTEPGVVQVVGELASAFKDVKAVAKAGWAMLGLVGFSTAVSLFSIFMTMS